MEENNNIEPILQIEPKVVVSVPMKVDPINETNRFQLNSDEGSGSEDEESDEIIMKEMEKFNFSMASHLGNFDETEGSPR